MRIDTGQYQQMRQKMAVQPRMIQSMEILQLSNAALEERIEQELASNPTLELREAGGEDPAEVAERKSQEARDDREGERELVVREESATEHNAEDFERLSNISEEYGDAWTSNITESATYRPARDNGERDGKMDAMANTAARPESMSEQLLNQWHLLETTDEVREAGEFLIGFIDNDGYLRTDMQDVLNQAPMSITREHLDEALECLQQGIEPIGIGARDVRECLLLQIDAAIESDDADLTLERAVVSDHLKDVESNRLPKIAKALDVEVERIKQSILHLRQFHIHPGRLLATENPQAITPDAIIEYDDESDCYTVQLSNTRVPAVQISPRYLEMVKDASLHKRDRDFINTHLRNGRWLIEAIEQRNNTLMRVIAVVVEAQRDFFDQGQQALKPLPMTLVADQLGIHVATVSRAVSEKYVQTPRGIFPLRMFFSGGTETESGDAMSWSAIQAKLQQIIDEEDKSKPLSDDALVKELNKHGIEIARRTVAKYRKQLNIASARQRKEF